MHEKEKNKIIFISLFKWHRYQNKVEKKKNHSSDEITLEEYYNCLRKKNDLKNYVNVYFLHLKRMKFNPEKLTK